MARGAVVAGAVMSMLTVSCAGGRILNARDILWFEVAESRTQPTVVLNISGMPGDSFPHTYEVSTVTDGDALLVLVHAHPVYVRALARPGGSELQEDLVIPAFVNTVLFGAEYRVIWRRDCGPVPWHP